MFTPVMIRFAPPQARGCACLRGNLTFSMPAFLTTAFVASSSADRETTDASRIRRRYQASVNAHQVLAHIVLEIPPQTGAAKTP